MGHPPHFQPGVRAPDAPSTRALCFVFRGRELLVRSDGRLPELGALEALELESLRSQYLGTLGDRQCHSVEVAADCSAPQRMAFRDLRALYGRLDETLHAIAGLAVQIVEWDRSHQYCGACGKPTERAAGERSRSCPDCRVPHFPRLSPAMIVAVERDDEILLARSPHFPAGIYSVLAGFVEPGESVEQAVAREVIEETGIRVGEVRYFGSQPWPYPHSLMLGFRADYESGEICIGEPEIEDARWFRADEMPSFFPGRMSISQWLIQDFLERHSGRSTSTRTRSAR